MVDIPLGIQQPIPGDIKGKWEIIQSKCSIALTKVLVAHHTKVGKGLMEKAKVLTDKAYQIHRDPYKEAMHKSYLI